MWPYNAWNVHRSARLRSPTSRPCSVPPKKQVYGGLWMGGSVTPATSLAPNQCIQAAAAFREEGAPPLTGLIDYAEEASGDCMSHNAYRRAPQAVDMAAEERSIRRDTTIATAVTMAGFVTAFWLGPVLADLPIDVAHRLAFAAVVFALPCFMLLVAVFMVSSTRRFSPEDIGGQAAGPPSERLAIKSAFLQNTLEQTVLAAGFYFALAAVAGGAWLALLPVAAGLFVVGRVLFYRGYPRGAQGRSLGMGLTIMPVALGYPLVAGLAMLGG